MREADVITHEADVITRDSDAATRDCDDVKGSSPPADIPNSLPRELVQELLQGALQKMLKVRQNKVKRELTSSPKYTERSPTSPEQLSPVRGG